VFSWKEDEIVECVLNEEETHRYLLTCTWDQKKPAVAFIMLNPSKGNTDHADPTMKRCAQFARFWGYGSMIVANLFSYITPFPDELKNYSPTEEEQRKNRKYVLQATKKAEKVIFAWGTIAAPYEDKIAKKIELVPLNKRYCITITKNGYPGHPLYLPKGTRPIKFD